MSAVAFLFEDCRVDTDRREIRRGTGIVSPGPQVFDLLVYLIRNRDRVVSKDDLLDMAGTHRIGIDPDNPHQCRTQGDRRQRR